MADHLHKQKFVSLLVEVPFNIMRTHFRSCAGPRVSIWLLVCLTTPTFCLFAAHFLITLHTHFGLPHPMVAHLSRCQCDHTINNLGIHLLWCFCHSECTIAHNTLQDIITTIVLESGTCSEGGLPPFSLPHSTMNGYPFHQIWLPNFDGCCHCWFDSHKYGVMNIDNNNTCNDDGYLGEDTIIRHASTRWWFHSSCYSNVCVFSFSFWFIFYHLCTYHYHM